jgi:cation diffusion facilitator family transporter
MSDEGISLREQRLALNVSLAVAVILLALKVWAAEATQSSALYSDAAESVVHVIAVMIAVAALRYAHKPADEEHQFGHDKAAFLSAGFEGAMISTAALFIVYESVRQMFQGPQMENLWIGAVLSATAMVINLVLGLCLLRIGRRRKSPVLTANGQHVMADVATSVAVLVALGLVHVTGWPWWDPIIALLAAANILYTGARLVKKSLSGLMDAAEPETEQTIRQCLDEMMKQAPFRYHHLRHRHSGHTHWVELHMVVADDMNVHEAHEIATMVEAGIADLLAPHGRIITHLEPQSEEELDETWEGKRFLP